MLKQKIAAVMQQSYPGISPVMSDWKSGEITDFQEELRIRVNAHVSEKWFYNHFKNQNPGLPRIDMLNLLSRFAGYLNWDDFRYRNNAHPVNSIQINQVNRYFIYLPLMMVGIFLILFVLFKLVSNREYYFSFQDALTKELITGDQTGIQILYDNESPGNYQTDSMGKFTLKTDKRSVKMVVSAPYFKADTITRILKTFEKNQKIGLYSDDYARMIQLFSEMKTDDWQKRRAALDSIIDNNAMIYQVGSGSRQIGIELYNKEEFIDKLTMPAGSLRNLDVLETKLINNKIAILRFRIVEEKR